ncbi:LuxR C-terminal-related transcriptional regulator [Pseudomonas aeruginosa]|uniref:LuxR C-terminal-related transcriptional regulator n=1 Tax=Pseudomonas aeruginosa TaxID=287 RepID=UPI0021E2575F|nr:LuxR C-terminal-related transcriptional regulator [Pseudomonas aeruginosa]MCV0298959.1 LuxR C-terminal-related transcriptional regulator [Pseudomonas aeruginosa]MCV0361572.1 LuxR C-terminal-related transcriptional regulator [Pseudomonas aeruginosa]MDY1144145.1 LuxR C-terminal-related transcriptional regulator [Pseudomonas aeruginosa]MDY1203626.1 LuxR C-terminal-related transcriptional regulator [Pseudomonas aeruginosa]MDY1482296.1 LuxR C-terminal-related transcriptional regulator [Pseudomon
MTDMPATADEPVRLLLVDDHPMMRKGVAQLLELEDDLSVVGEAGSGEEALRLAATGQMTLSPQLTQILAQALRGDDRSKSLDELTERERQILRQIAHGYSNKMIARKLDITEGTVKVHVKRVLHKLGMRSRVEAAVWAVENDLV